MAEAVAVVAVPVADLARGASRAFEAVFADGTREPGILVRGRDGLCRAFANRCPHVPRYGLDFGDGDVIDPRDGLIVCANHGARFVPETGACTSGPCLGRELYAWPCEEAGAVARVDARLVPAGWPHLR